MSFQPIKVETSIIPHFHVIFTEKFITYIIFMFQGHSQGQNVNFKVNYVKMGVFLKARNMCNTSFSCDFHRINPFIILF